MYLAQGVLFLRTGGADHPACPHFFGTLPIRKDQVLCRGRYKICPGFPIRGQDGDNPNFTGGAEHMRVKITLACSECKQRNYDTKKNKKNDPDRLELNKYCRFCRKHTLHRETK